MSRPPTINVKRARRCLDCAEFAYLDFGIGNGAGSQLDYALRTVGIGLINTYDRQHSQGFLAYADGDFILSVRGTSELGDWLSDLNYAKTDFRGGGRVHRGFYNQFLAIEPDIARDLNDFHDKPLLVTGHSLGAGPAQMAGVWFQATEGYVFGSPRVGNRDFVKRVRYPLVRFEHWTDPVCFVPPRTSPWIFTSALLHFRKPTFYDRAGKAVLLDGALHRMEHYRKSAVPYFDQL